jgi:hypothetical protein
LASFVRKGNKSQVEDFWQLVATEMDRRLTGEDGNFVWMSTCGLSVHWLSVRLDSTPKYYSYTPYKQPSSPTNTATTATAATTTTTSNADDRCAIA